LKTNKSPARYAYIIFFQFPYKKEIKGLELFAFAVESDRLKCRVYFKFALVEKSLWLVSLHQNRPI